jgi:two-component system sensor histidine kinase TctE
MPPSLRRTLLKWLLIPLLSLLALSAVAIYRLALGFAWNAYDRALGESAEDIVQLIQTNARLNKSVFEFSKTARALILDDKYDRSYYSIRSERGLLLGGDATLPLQLIGPTLGPVFYDASIDGQPVRVVSLPTLLHANEHTSLIHVQMAETLHKRETLAREILTLMIVPQLLLILLAAGIVWYAVGRGLRPLAQLEASITARSPLDLEPMQINDVPAEIRPLIGALNGLLQRVVSVLDSQARFVADASHQLRTPLAGLKAHIALAVRQRSPDDMRYSLGQLDVGVGKLTHLVNQLLSLARNEPGADRSLQLRALDLNALAQSVTGEWLSTALKRGIDLGFEGAGGAVTIQGDPLRLTELLNNLLDNALRYCPSCATVTVRVLPERLLEVEDNGPGIPVTERERIFERFHRLHEQQIDGNGLGLAIVREIAVIHQATLTLTDGQASSGSCFRLIFPPVRI